MEKKILPYLVVFSALSVSLSAAFYSVYGVSKLFSGASYQVMIMMGSLEIAKLVLASLLYQYWDSLNKLLKFYYFIAVFCLMALTSVGIYGYLSSAYSETANKVENIDKKIAVMDLKRNLFVTQLDEIKSEKESVTKNISELTRALSNNVIQYKDRSGQMITTTSSANRKTFESQLESSQKRRDDMITREVALSDSISSIDIQKLNLETNSDVASELGPLKYIAKVSNKPIDTVVNWFIIALMLVFDPLAVSLVVGANVIFKQRSKEREKEKKLEDIDQKLENFDKRESEIQEINTELRRKEDEISEREARIKSKEEEVFSDLEKRESEYKNRLNDISIKEEELIKRIEEKENISKDFSQKSSDLDQEIESFKKREEEINTQKSEIEKEKSEIEKDRQKIESDRIELNNLKAELDSMDKDIKKWESMHWKLKKRKV